MRRIRSPPFAVIVQGERHHHDAVSSTRQTASTTTTTLNFLRLSLTANLFLLVILMATWSKLVVLNKTDTGTSTDGSNYNEAKLLRHETIKLRQDVQTWHGGHPAAQHQGSCWCNQGNNNNNDNMNQYCMCTPNVAIDLIVVVTSSSQSQSQLSSSILHPNNNSNNIHIDADVWLARRKDTGQYATVGGFVMLGESVEQAVFRELQEETGLTRAEMQRPPELVGVYSDPQRDNRRHTVSVVYAIYLKNGDDDDDDDNNKNKPVANDDVKEVIRVPLQDIEKYDFFADHRTILLDYRQQRLLHLEHNNNNNKEKQRTTSGSMVIPSTTTTSSSSSSAAAAARVVFPANVQRSICDSSAAAAAAAAAAAEGG